MTNVPPYRFGAPTVLMVCYDKSACWVRRFDKANSGEIDGSIVTTHLMLAAQEQGLGSCMVKMLLKNTYGFIPSPIWRKIQNGIISTTRFAGILFISDMRLAVYHIGDGDMEWQTYAERSLFFETYGKQEDRATGMLLICDGGKGPEIAADIVKHTLWRDKTLIKQWNDYIF